MPSAPDYYAILQVDQYAEREVIEVAYRRLAAKYHPDVNQSSQALEKMKLLNAAYEVLSNPEKRKAYDSYRNQSRTQEKPATGTPSRGRPWWLLPASLAFIILALRINPRILFVLIPIFIVIWVFWNKRTSNRE